jgi:membrane-associated phospholipid phosphatase
MPETGPMPDDPRPAPSRLRRVRDHVVRRAPEPVRFDLTFHAPRWLVWSAATVTIAAVLSYLLLDKPIRDIMHNLPAFLEQVSEWITIVGEAWVWLVAGSIACIVLGLVRRTRALARRCTLIVATAAASGLLAIVLKVIFGRARPGAWWEHGMWGFDPLSIGYDVNSFPSGHAATVGSVAMALILIWPRRWVWFAAAAALVACTRVLLESHYLSDIIVGLYVGVLTTMALHQFIWKDWGIWQDNPRPAPAAGADPQVES